MDLDLEEIITLFGLGIILGVIITLLMVSLTPSYQNGVCNSQGREFLTINQYDNIVCGDLLPEVKEANNMVFNIKTKQWVKS